MSNRNNRLQTYIKTTTFLLLLLLQDDIIDTRTVLWLDEN